MSAQEMRAAGQPQLIPTVLDHPPGLLAVFRVDITRVDHEVIYVLARDEDIAKAIARELADDDIELDWETENVEMAAARTEGEPHPNWAIWIDGENYVVPKDLEVHLARIDEATGA